MDYVKKYEQNWKVPVLGEAGAIDRILPNVEKAPEDETPKVVPNFIFRASLLFVEAERAHRKSVRRNFVDREDGVIVPFTRTGVDDLFRALKDGDIQVRNGALCGYFTLKNIASNISARPLSEEEKLKFNLN